MELNHHHVVLAGDGWASVIDLMCRVILEWKYETKCRRRNVFSKGNYMTFFIVQKTITLVQYEALE